MLESLKLINNVKRIKDIDKNEYEWLYYLIATKEQNYNLKHLKALSELNNKSVLNYVIRSLNILNEERTSHSSKIIYYVEETLKWMDVAKCGRKSNRNDWAKKGYDLFVHNIGSSKIYAVNNSDEIVEVLIRTHGLIGQYLKGEVLLSKNKDLYNLVNNKLIKLSDLKEILILLNKCIIGAIDDNLWIKVKGDVELTIDRILNNETDENNYNDKNYILNRLIKLRGYATKEEENNLRIVLNDDNIKNKLGLLLSNLEIWFLDSALYNFSLEEIVKILLIVHNFYKENPNFEHLSFENVMKDIYIDYNGKRVINIYKKRIIESFLKEFSFNDIINNHNQHISIVVESYLKTILITFTFSKPAQKLIDFCEIAYGTDSIFNKAVFMLYDLFGFRRDEYDRFYNEIDYLKTMNASLSKKAVILDYINGQNILDVGPGGGALMNLIEEKLDVNVFGIDISENVIEELSQKKILENRKWQVLKGDALELKDYFKKGEIDTIIYSSIIHELFSYIPFEDKKFNHNTIKKALKSAYDILPDKGRIIIRDGIMTEGMDQKRIIRFKNIKDMDILKRYCNDFKGREVTFDSISSDTVMMRVNDAMEFLYTYTWGEGSYSLEVKEQFGYFTPNQYVNFINEIFDNKCKIIECKHFLQDGYEEHLLEKIDFYDENYMPVPLPDSTCIIVVEKIL